MKKAIVAIFALATLTVNASDNRSLSLESDSNIELKDSKKASERDYSTFLTPALIDEIGKMEHADLMSGRGADDMIVKVVYFTAPGWEHESAFAQIDYVRGEVTESSLVFFTPDGEGNLSPNQMGMCPVEEHPCDVCVLDKIEIKDERIWVTFVGRTDASKVQKFIMETNFQEMSIWWEQ